MEEQRPRPLEEPRALRKAKKADVEVREAVDGNDFTVLEPGAPEFEARFGEADADPAPLADPSSAVDPQARSRAASAAPLCTGFAWCAEYTVGSSWAFPTPFQAGRVNVMVKNVGTTAWAAGQVALGYHVYDSAGNVVQFVNAMTTIDVNVYSNSAISVSVVLLPRQSGSYKYVFDLYRMSPIPSKWFSQLDSPVPASTAYIINVAHVPPIGWFSNPQFTNVTFDTQAPSFSVYTQKDPSVSAAVMIGVCRKDVADSCVNSGWLAMPDNSGGAVNWTVPDGHVYWNKNYIAYFRIQDGHGGPVIDYPSQMLDFVASVPQPVGAHLGSDPSQVDDNGVGLFVGNYVHRAVDLEIAGARQTLAVPRTYNSASHEVGAFGYGWTSMLDARWTPSSDGRSFEVRFPDGAVKKYARNPDGTWAGGFGEPLNRRIFADDRQITFGKTTYKFDPQSGGLQYIRSGYDDVIKINRNAGGIPTSIEEGTSGRRIYLSWTGQLVTGMSSGPNGTGIAWTFSYKTLNRLHRVCDPRTSWPCLTYNYTYVPVADDGLEIVEIDAVGTDDITIAYNGRQVSSIEQPDGAQSIYTHATIPGVPVGDVFAVARQVTILGERLTRRVSFNRTGAILEDTDNIVNGAKSTSQPFTERTSYVYNVFGQLTAEIDKNSNPTEFGYDGVTGAVNVVRVYRDNEVRATEYLHYRPDVYRPTDPLVGNLLRVRNQASKDVVYSYRDDSTGFLATKTEAVGDDDTATTTYEYTCLDDEGGFAPAVVNDPTAGPGETQPCSLISAITQPGSRRTEYEYNRFGDVTRVTTPTGLRTDTWRDDFGRAQKVTESSPENPGGKTIDYTYNSIGQVTSETWSPVADPITGAQARYRATYAYNPTGTLASKVETDIESEAATPPTRTTEYAYDVRNRVSEVSQGGTVLSRQAYNGFGQVTDAWDANNNHRRLSYWPRGELKEEQLVGYVNPQWVQPAGAERTIVLRSMAYDAGGRLIDVRDGAGGRTLYDWTQDDRVRRERRLRDTSTFITAHEYSYDDAGNVASDKRTADNGSTRTITMSYDDADRMTRQIVDVRTTTNPNGLNYTTQYTYDPQGDLTERSIDDGTRRESERLTYRPDGRLRHSTIENGAVDLTTAYTVGGDGRLRAVTDPRGTVEGAPSEPHTSRFAFDKWGRPTTVRLPQAATFDGASVDHQIDDQSQTLIAYDVFGQPRAERRADGGMTVYERGARGELLREVVFADDSTADSSSALAVTSYQYDANGNVTVETDPEGNTVTFTYDALDQVVQVTQQQTPLVDAYAPTDRYAYDDAGRLVYHVDPVGLRTAYEYDTLGNQVRQTATESVGVPTAQDIETVRTFDDFGNRLTTRVTGTGVTETLTYDAADRPATRTVTGLGTTTFKWDLAGRLVEERSPAPESIVQVHDYDLAGRRASITRRSVATGNAQKTEWSYDAAGNALAETDARGNQTAFEWDARNQLRRTIEPEVDTGSGAGNTVVRPTTSFGYDAVGNRTQVTDANGNTTLTRYDSRSLPTSVLLPAAGPHVSEADRSYTYAYDRRGLPIEETVPGGVSVTSTYDKRGNLINQAGVRGATTSERLLRYDGANRIIAVSRPGTEAIEYTRDLRGNPIKAFYTDDEDPEFKPTLARATYDSLNRTTSTEVTGADLKTTYTYSGALLASTTDVSSGVTQRWIYDAAGRVMQKRSVRSTSPDVFPTAVETISYDSLGRLRAQSLSDGADTGVGEIRYTWDANDNLLSRVAFRGLRSSASDFRYVYDAADRLISVHDISNTVNPDGSVDASRTTGQDYIWDPAGNRTTTKPWSGDPAIKSYGPSHDFSYDTRNRLTQWNSSSYERSYAYDADGTLRQTTVLDDEESTSSDTRFDAFGQLVQDGSVAYQYDALGRLTQAFRHSGTNGIDHFSYQMLDREPTVIGQGSTQWIVGRTPGGTPRVQRKGTDEATNPTMGLLTSPHRDVIGSYSIANAQLTSTTSYGALGEKRASSGQAGPVGWQGSYRDPTTGRTRADSRWYDPAMGRFISPDQNPPPITSAASANSYGYGDGNPTSSYDPAGTWAVPNFINGSTLGDIGRLIAGGVDDVATAGARLAGTPAVTWGTRLIGLGATAATVVAATATVAAVAGIAYLAWQLSQPQNLPDVQISPPATAAPQVTAQSVTSSSASTSKTAKSNWSDGTSLYVQTKTTTITKTTTVTTYTDGTTKSQTTTGSPQVQVFTKSQPLIDLTNAIPARGSPTVSGPQPPARTDPAQATCSGAAVGVVCPASPTQSSLPAIPTAPDRQLAGASGGNNPPTPPTRSGPAECPDPSDEGNAANTGGYNNALRGPDGRFSTNPNSARSNASPSSSTHGNALASDARTWLYRRLSNAGEFKKWGITSNLRGRYGTADLGSDIMVPMTSGSRLHMSNLERWLVENDPGPDNHEPWAGDGC